MFRYVIVAIIIILVIGIIAIGCNRVANNTNKAMFRAFQPGELIDFQLYNSYTIDTRGLREQFRVVEGTPYVFFQQLTMINRNSWNSVFNRFRDIEARVEYDDFDFNFDDFSDNYFIITVGRELEEIRVIGMSESPHRPHMPEVAVTFAEEYRDGALFIYTMDRIPFPFEDASAFYFMEGSERVFMGSSIFDLMEFYPIESLRRD